MTQGYAAFYLYTVPAKHSWNRHPTTGAYYQLNTQSALTWAQAEVSCRQQGASLLSITDPHQQAYVTGKGTILILLYGNA